MNAHSPHHTFPEISGKRDEVSTKARCRKKGGDRGLGWEEGRGGSEKDGKQQKSEEECRLDGGEGKRVCVCPLRITVKKKKNEGEREEESRALEFTG